MRILVYGDSNSWGYLDDGSGQRYAGRWPQQMVSQNESTILWVAYWRSKAAWWWNETRQWLWHWLGRYSIGKV